MQETHVRFLYQEGPLEEGMVTHSSILAGESQRQRSLMGYSPWGRKESDTTEVTEHAPRPERISSLLLNVSGAQKLFLGNRGLCYTEGSLRHPHTLPRGQCSRTCPALGCLGFPFNLPLLVP